ncbi:MAG: ATP-binding protein [Peptostreptococcaceae bacterium]
MNIVKMKERKIKKSTGLILILILSTVIFGMYILRLFNILSGYSGYEFTRSEFIRFFDVIMSLLAVVSCLLSYRSNNKEELFFIIQMYIVFSLDIIISNTYNHLSNSVGEYIAMGSSVLKIMLLVLTISKFKNLKRLMIKHKIQTSIITILLSIIVINVEHYYSVTYFIEIDKFFIFFKIVAFIIYLIIAAIFFKRSIHEQEYIYGVIATSIIMFATKCIYSIFNIIVASDEIKLTSVSLTYMGFIVLILGLFIELSQNIKRVKELEEERSLFFNIVDENEHSSIILCDDGYNVIYMNKRALDYEGKLKIIDKSNKEFRIDLSKIFKDKESYIKFRTDINKHGCYNENVKLKEVDKMVDMSVQVIQKNKKILNVVTLKDITNLYEMEKSILEYKHIRDEENMKNEFFSNISHELKTPLNIIYSTIQLLNFSLDKENFKELYIKYKKTVDINCKRMIRLIDNIVDITKFEVGFKHPEYNNYEIISIIENLVMSTVNYAKMKGIDILFDTEIEELDMKCDPNMLERILLNLLSNSIKFTNKNGNILVYVQADEKWIRIKVKDDGIGIPIEKQATIFDRFVQGDKSITRQNEGSGIGLSIVKNLIDLMDGEINLYSDGQNGCEFIINLPNRRMTDDDNVVETAIHNTNLQSITLEFSDIYELFESNEIYEYSY